MSKKNKKNNNVNKGAKTAQTNNNNKPTTVVPVTSFNPTKSTYSQNNTTSFSSYYKPHVYKGTKNETEFPDFVELCKLTQEELKEVLPKKLLAAGYTDVVTDDGFIYAKGEFPVLLTAHMDTVHVHKIIDFYEYVDTNGNHIISSPQGIGGDDRCGIYMILDIIKEYKPSILFCEDEEIGGIGSNKFCRTEFINELAELKYLIELDRANGNDAVFYDCDNPEFTKFIEDNTGYKKTHGSFSDISHLAPMCKVAAVNFSCGYYRAHQLTEEVNVEEMLHTIETVKKLFEVECEQFEYIEKKYTYYNRFGSHWYDDDDYYDDFYWRRYARENGYGYGYNDKQKSNSVAEKKKDTILYVTFYDPHTYEEITEGYIGETEAHAWVKFFKENPDVCYNLVLDYDIDSSVF